MGLKKQDLPGSNTCKVSFTLPKVAVKSAKIVHLVGEFNSWNVYATPMKKQKDGSFEVTLELEKGREYQYRYFLNNTNWENDWNADKYVPSSYGDSDNSVVVV